MTLAETARALADVHERFTFDLTPAGPDWHPYPSLPERLPEWVAELTAAGRAPSEVAMSLLSGVTGPVLRPIATAWVLRGEALLVEAGSTAVRRRGRVTDRAALGCRVGSDPAELAPALAALVAPVVETLHRATRFGRRNMWGGIADVLTSHSLWAGRHRGDPPEALHEVFAQVQALLDTLPVTVRFPRPTPFPVTGPDRETLAQVRGTCCLHYRIPGRTHPDGAAGPGATPHAPTPRYCSTCPLIDDTTRRHRMRPLVEPTAAATRTTHLGTPAG